MEPTTHLRRSSGLLALGCVALVLASCGGKDASPDRTARPTAAPAGQGAGPATPPVPLPVPDVKLETMETAKSVMVTVELDFGPTVPTVAEALRDIERRHKPDDNQGRTFAILDAYGEPTADRKLHMSMHISAEKPGIGALVFRRTGQVLWQTRIVPGSTPSSFTGKNLSIMVTDGKGKDLLLDGTRNPQSILDTIVKDQNVPLRDVWPEGEEREATFVYSACGCPVKVSVRRAGDRVLRTKDTPVIFPDDPGAVQVISKLMKW